MKGQVEEALVARCRAQFAKKHREIGRRAGAMFVGGEIRFSVGVAMCGKDDGELATTRRTTDGRRKTGRTRRIRSLRAGGGPGSYYG